MENPNEIIEMIQASGELAKTDPAAAEQIEEEDMRPSEGITTAASSAPTLGLDEESWELGMYGHTRRRRWTPPGDVLGVNSQDQIYFRKAGASRYAKWEHLVDGALMQVAVAGGNDFLNAWGVNAAGDVFIYKHRQNAWKHIKIANDWTTWVNPMKQVAVSIHNNYNVWALTTHGHVFYRVTKFGGVGHVAPDAAGNWMYCPTDGLPGWTFFKWVSTYADDNVWGVTTKDEIFFRKGAAGAWEKVGGALKQVSAGEVIWGVNSKDQVYYMYRRWNYNGGNYWVHTDGSMKQVAVSSDFVWGVNSKDEIFYRDGTSGSWKQIGGALKQVAVY